MADNPRFLVVPDTNVCVSGGTISASPPAQIIQAWRIGAVDFAFCEPILAEINEVLQRPYFADRVGWTRQQIRQYVSELRDGSIIVPGTVAVSVSADPDDNMLFSCAVEAVADFVVTGDTKHLLPLGAFEGIPIVSPRQFVEVLQEQKAA